jgi:protoporphyrinogen oxidase
MAHSYSAGSTAPVTILGSGMGGCGAANRLHAEGITPVMYDMNPHGGGHTASFAHSGGFVFDIGPHISYTKDPRLQQLFAASVDEKYETLQIHLNNYWRGYWPTHPVQLHLYGLPTEDVVACISGFVAEHQAADREINNYEDWLLASFGRAFAERFPMQYTRKYHLTDAKNLTIDWLGPRIYRPNLEEVLRGALSADAPNIHPYISHFRYPTHGGFNAYLRDFHRMADLKLGHKVVRIDPKTRELTFANGQRATYGAVVSSIPLPELIPLIEGVPADVLDAAGRLACSTCVLVNVAVDREDISQAHMSYFYDEDICFTRLSFPHMLSPNNAPKGTGSIQAEVYFSKKYRPLTVSGDSLIDPVIADLRKVGLIRETDRIIHRNAMVAPYANVIFDHERVPALATVHGFLDDVGISYCGRYGDWAYLWTDESFLSGERAAEKALGRAGHRAAAAVPT